MRLVRVILAFAVASMCSLARAQSDDEEPPTLRPNERVELNLDGGDLGDLVRTMNRITGHSFVVTGAMRQLSASITSSAPVTVAEAYRAFLAILHQNGLTVVRRGRHYHVVATEGIGPAPTPIVRDGDAIPIDERFVTWIHHVEHVPVGDAAQVLETLRSPDGQLVTYAPTQTLILIDTGVNVRRMRLILAEVDVARGDAHVWVEPVHYGDATAIAEQLRELFAAEARDAPAPRPGAPSPNGHIGAPNGADLHRVIPEPRTNKLILVATQSGYHQVIAILREIDRPDGAEATVRVHRLQHGDSAAIATTLQALLSSGTGPNAQAETPIAGLRGRVRVEAHADLNALVITSSPADYRVLHQLIDDLDAAPRQVFLEMVLMELSVEHGDELGANLLSGLAELFGPGTIGLIGGGGGAALAGDLMSGLNLAASGPMIPGTSTPTFGVLIHALATSDQVNILSTPSILVLDNREALINVGQNVPLQGSSVPGVPSVLSALTSQQTEDASALSTALSQQTSTPARRDTGTIVHVTPHINDDGEIRLEIQAEDSRAGDVAAGNLGAVALYQSIAETELVVRDGHTVVIGGLMRDSVETHESGVPVLSDIPLIGPLFGRRDRRTIRSNLVFFVTPYIVRGPSDMRAITERRMRERREFMDRHMVFEGDWEPSVDYSRTRGLVSEILDTIARIDAEAELEAAQATEVMDHVGRPPIDLE